MLTSLLFALFAGLSNDWKLVLPVSLVAALMPLLFLEQKTALIIAVGTAAILLLNFLYLENSLKSYLSFTPSTIFGPPIRHLSGFLILLIALTYFLSISNLIGQKGFEIPDQLIDQALKLSGQTSTQSEEQSATQPTISPEQLELLKKNPALLKQFGVDPKMLNNLNPGQTSQTIASTSNDLLKTTLKNQLNSMIKPYIGLVPAILAILFFFILQSLTALLNILVYPVLWLIFYIFEKVGFVSFITETRSVKKMTL